MRFVRGTLFIILIIRKIVRIVGWSFIGLGLIVLVGACAKSESKPGTAGNIPYSVEVPEVNVARVLNDAEVVCEKEPCHEGVGFLIAKVSSESNSKTVKLKQCTAFLIHKTLMLTNAHCLPPEIQKRNSACRGLVEIKLQRRAGEAKSPSVQCESIVYSSPIVSDPKNPDFVRIPDYALIRVSGDHDRKHFEISREGLADGLDVQSLVVDPMKENSDAGPKLRGIIRRKSCRAIVGTTVVPGAVQSHYAVSTVAGCNIIQGNSGSPVFDSNGKIRGVISATVPAQAAPSSPSNATPEKYETVNVVANAACMKLPSYVSAHPIPQPEACGKHLTENDLVARAVAKPTGSIGSLFETWKAAAPKPFGFELFNKKVEEADKLSVQASLAKGKISIPMTYPTMKCIQPPAGWARAEAPQGMLSYKRDGEKAEMSFEIPVWSLRTKQDRFYRIDLVPSQEGKAVVHALIHDVSKALESRETLVDYTIESAGDLVKARAVNQKLPLCVD